MAEASTVGFWNSMPTKLRAEYILVLSPSIT